MRGKEVSHSPRTLVLGITPAYAGKRWTGETATVNVGDHPRLCGEKCVSYEYGFKIRGSPPPMRGKVMESGESAAIMGITPAYAGKSHDVYKHHRSFQDHPRLCGEK